MAKAELEIKISDSGPSPVGRSAPGGSAWSQQVTRPMAPAQQVQQPKSAGKGSDDTTTVWQGTKHILNELGLNKIATVGDKIERAFSAIHKHYSAPQSAAAAAHAASTQRAQHTAQNVANAARVAIPSAPPIPVGAGAGAAEAAGGLSRVAAVAGPAAIAIAAVAATVGAAVGTVKKFKEGLDENVAILRRLNGTVAFAAARSELNMMLAELRRGNAIGEQLAAYETARNKLEVAAYEIWTKILDALLTVFVPVMEFLAKVLEELLFWLTGQRQRNDIHPFTQQILEMALQPLK